jgi:methylmalonyl-CoA mutase, N-terminal domain
LDKKEKIIVGVNDFIEENEKIEIPILEISPEVESKQIKRLADVRASRNNEEVERRLEDLKSAARDGNNLIPHLLNATNSYVTLGEMSSALAEVFGVYEEQAVF